LEALENWKNINAKITWIVVSLSIGLVLTTAWQTIF